MAIDIILSGFKWNTCLVYLDDVIVFSGSRSAHLAHVAEVSTLLGNVDLSMKLKKCHFFSETVDYLGHVIRPSRLEVAEKNTAVLKTAPLPRTQTELRSFRGFATSTGPFVPRFSAIDAPLNALLCKGMLPQLGPLPPPAVAAFAELRDRLLTPPVLARFSLYPELRVVFAWIPTHRPASWAVAYCKINLMVNRSPWDTVHGL
jgi:Reverse transcriptase (RNA-dependent DNA polymerase)